MPRFQADKLSPYNYDVKKILREGKELPLISFDVGDEAVPGSLGIKMKDLILTRIEIPQGIEEYDVVLHFCVGETVLEVFLELKLYKDGILKDVEIR